MFYFAETVFLNKLRVAPRKDLRTYLRYKKEKDLIHLIFFDNPYLALILNLDSLAFAEVCCFPKDT